MGMDGLEDVEMLDGGKDEDLRGRSSIYLGAISLILLVSEWVADRYVLFCSS